MKKLVCLMVVQGVVMFGVYRMQLSAVRGIFKIVLGGAFAAMIIKELVGMMRNEGQAC